MALTKIDVLKMPMAEVFAAIKNPKTQTEMVALMKNREVAVYVDGLLKARAQGLEQAEAIVDQQLSRTAPPPSTETLAAEAVSMAATPETPAVPEVVSTVPETVSATPPTPPVEEKKKIVREYQVRDEDGNPIGRPTHLEAWSMEEMLEKMQNAHENATRAFHRLKKQKVSFQEQEKKRILSPDEIKATAAKALEAKDAAEAEKIVRSVIESDFKKREDELQARAYKQQGEEIANAFMRTHITDFLPCQANFNAMTEWLKQHDMDFTLDNLEVAFLDLQAQGDKLAPLPSGSVASVPAAAVTNTPAAAAPAAPAVAELPPAPAPAPAPVSAPPAQTPAVETSPAAAEATATTPAAAVNPAPNATRRPAVPAGIQPGTLSAKRPEAVDPTQARKDFLKTVREMKPEVMKAKLKNDPQFVKQLESYGIRVR